MAGKKKKAAEQMQIEGTERVQNKKVAAAGRAFRRVGEEHRELGREKKKAGEKLIAIMRAEGVLHYIDDEARPPIEIKLTAKDEVKAKEWKGPKAPPVEEPEEEPGEPEPETQH